MVTVSDGVKTWEEPSSVSEYAVMVLSLMRHISVTNTFTG
jgi:hypothetical protein